MPSPFFHTPAILLFLTLFCACALAENVAEVLFEQSRSMVYQIKVIDLGSGDKKIIGSGFLIDSDGTVATNYHVISEFIISPDKYRIVLSDHEENTFPLQLINYDIVHDLALVKVETELAGTYFSLSEVALPKGSRIYSMGNPHDLGMTIVEGNYNGLVEGSRHQKYLFSGSLNSGMSGGPAINQRGEVIGVNVAKGGGEQLSFLVPVKYLRVLIHNTDERIPADQYKAHSLQSLLVDQDDYFSRLIDIDWPTRGFMNYTLPDKVDDLFKCWGHTADKKKKRYDRSSRHCRTENWIYVSRNLWTGSFAFSYQHISTEELGIIPFYGALEERYKISGFRNGKKNDVTNFICTSDFVGINKMKWKATSCLREYIEYRGLYDTALLAMRVDQNHEALVVKIRTTGINQNNMQQLHRKFLSSIQWKE